MRRWRIAGTMMCGMVVVGGCLWAMTGMVNQADTDTPILPMGQMTERVQDSTMFEQTVYYTDCQESEMMRAKASAKVVGMTRDEVAKLYREWQITSFDSNVVALKLSVDGVCKAHRESQFLGIHDGMVAIYYGRPGESAILKEMLQIDAALLVTQVQEELKKGIPFQSEEEKLRILEGIQAR